MLIQLLSLVLLVVLISRKSIQLGISAGGPMAVAAGLWILICFVLFRVFSGGVIQVRADTMLEGLMRMLPIYAAAFVAIYLAMVAWLKAKSRR